MYNEDQNGDFSRATCEKALHTTPGAFALEERLTETNGGSTLISPLCVFTVSPEPLAMFTHGTTMYLWVSAGMSYRTLHWLCLNPCCWLGLAL